MVKVIPFALSILLGACSQQVSRPNIVEPELVIPQMEPIESGSYSSYDYPQSIESIIKNAPSVVPVNIDGSLAYRPSTSQDTDSVMLLLTVEQSYLVRDLFVAARENKALADKLINIERLSVEERNQLLRILKLEAYRMQRTQAFTEYYKAELERVETDSTIESWTLKILTALSLAVAL